MSIPSNGIIDRIRRGELNLEKLVEMLRQTGYITEENQENDCSFSSSGMEVLQQDDFDKLFLFFFPNEVCDIVIDCIATDRGGQRGSYAYAIFNSNVVNRSYMQQLLERQNMKNHR